MDKHKLNGLWHRFKNSSLILLSILFIASVALSIYSLRSNNLNMITLREAVYTADQQNDDINTALNTLREYVHSHMNTSSEASIQLVSLFDRAVRAEQARVIALGSTNQVYIDAQQECEISSLPLTVRAQCMQDYITTHGGGVPQLNLPPKEAYIFDFVSPFWSPDLAGLSVVATVLIGLILIARLILGLFIKKYLKD